MRPSLSRIWAVGRTSTSATPLLQTSKPQLTPLNRVSRSVDNLIRVLGQELESPFELPALLEDHSMVHEDLPILVLALRHIPEHLLERSQGSISFPVLACEVLGDGEGDPIAPDAGLRAQDGSASNGVFLVVP